jgi:hypothetical protein
MPNDTTPTARDTLSYAQSRATRSARGWKFAWWSLALSLIPPAILFCIVYYNNAFGRWLNMGQGAERVTGVTWIIIALLSAQWAIVLICFARKTALVLITLALHLATVGLSVGPPGMFAIPFFMHWLHGPGA